MKAAKQYKIYKYWLLLTIHVPEKSPSLFCTDAVGTSLTVTEYYSLILNNNLSWTKQLMHHNSAQWTTEIEMQII